MEIDQINQQVTLLAEKHSAAGDEIEDWVDSEMIEYSAAQLIASYCEEKGYQVDGFPHEKRKHSNELDEDYFCRERFRFYLDTLATTHDDVTVLMWHFVSSFWKDQFESKDDYITTLRYGLSSEVFYEFRM